MNKTIVAAALGGILAGATGCPQTSRPAQIPGAPGHDPEGATTQVVHTGEAATGEKHACNSDGCGAMNDPKGKAPSAPKPTPSPNP